MCVCVHLPEDGDRASLRNVVIYKEPDDGYDLVLYTMYHRQNPFKLISIQK
jgi:hypothetical protein